MLCTKERKFSKHSIISLISREDEPAIQMKIELTEEYNNQIKFSIAHTQSLDVRLSIIRSPIWLACMVLWCFWLFQNIIPLAFHLFGSHTISVLFVHVAVIRLILFISKWVFAIDEYQKKKAQLFSCAQKMTKAVETKLMHTADQHAICAILKSGLLLMWSVVSVRFIASHNSRMNVDLCA